MLTIIANVTRDWAIGLRGRLLYPIKADLQRFKELTMGHPILMGRRTFESLPKGALPGRRNLVLSHQSLTAPGIEVYSSIEKALAACQGEEIFVIGGAEVYQQTIALAQRILLTEVDAEASEADAFFPSLAGWRRVAQTEWFTDERCQQRYRFSEWRRQ